MPWRLTAWNGHLLADDGWLFSTTSELEPAAYCQTTAPCEVLVVAPDEADAVHLKAIREVFESVWSEPDCSRRYLRIVRTGRELEHALAGMRPHVIYLYTRATERGGRPGLLLAGQQRSDSYPLERLVEHLRAQSQLPAVIYLNVGYAEGTGEQPSRLIERLGTVAPLVIARRLSGRGPEANSLATAWLRRWLEKREDPIQALHEVSRQNQSAEGDSVLVHAHYLGWQIDATIFAVPEP